MAEHPGATLRRVMKQRHISQMALANEMNMAQSHLSQLMNQHRPLSRADAVKLELADIGTAAFWLEAQAAYDTEMARRELEQAA